jgi:hypothetical protein
MTPGRKFSITTSAVRTRRRNTSLPAVLLRLMVTERLPAFLGEERGPHQRPVERGICAELAGEIARTGRLDLDDLSAQQRELIGPERPCQHIGEIEHTNAAEKPAHTHVRSVSQNLCVVIPRHRAAVNPESRRPSPHAP